VSPGFRPIASRSTHFNPLVLWQDWRSGGAEVSSQDRANLLQRTTAYKQSRWLKPVTSVYGWTERVLGRMQMADNLVMVLEKAPQSTGV
jgi:hypothetical protein